MGEPTMMVRTPSGQIEAGDDAGATERETCHEVERLPPDAVPAALGVDAVAGLSPDEARARAGLWGPNALRVRPPVRAWRRLLVQFADPLVLLLVAAAGISAGLWLRGAVAEGKAGPPFEAIAILAIVILNAAMGFIQEARAGRAVAALRRMSAARARVVRDGIRLEIPATELVPGDVIRIAEVDAIPADARLIEASALRASEAALTGESVPVPKDAALLAGEASPGGRRNMVFRGTAIVSGRGVGIVTATGMRTEIGRIASLLEETPQETTPLQAALTRLSRRLGLAIVAIAAALAATIVLVEEIRTLPALLDTPIVAVALAVAAVPEGLPAIVTAALSLGVLRMARRHAIVRQLAAVETLGSADVIASDKTGTLTRNAMTVRVVVTASGRCLLDGAPRASASTTCPTCRHGSPGGRSSGRSRRAGCASRRTSSSRRNSASTTSRAAPGPGCIATR